MMAADDGIADRAAAAAAAAATPPAAADGEAAQRAVEQFIEQHAAGEAPDLAAFVAAQPQALRPAILARCREYLAFDGLLGHQPWRQDPATDAPAPTGPAAAGRAFGDFVIEEELGRGGMGIVYLARQRSLQRRVALKVMAGGLTLSRRHVERFRREANAAAQVKHPAIVPVHALIEVDGAFALAMDYVAGRNLGDILDDLRLCNAGDGAPSEGTLGLAPDKGYVGECALFAAELAAGLAAAHAVGVVHRDLKPRNLMLDERRQVRLLDFGLAKSVDDGSISISGEMTGTPHYMSPEQTLAKRVAIDHRSDVWALGVILYEMLTLRRPFDGKNLQQIVYEICFQEPVPIQARNPKVPRDLATVCMKAMEKDPVKRYASAAEFEADLRRFLNWEPVLARPATAWSRATKWMRRHRTETAVAALAALAGVGALGHGVVRGRQADALLSEAAVAERAGRLGEAYRLAGAALDLRNDEATRARMERYAEADRRIEAEAGALALRSASLVDRDRARAIKTALQADDLRSSPSTRSAVLEALGSGSVVRTLQLPDGEARRLVGARLAPDGAIAATFGFAGHAQLWRTADGAPVAALRGHGAGSHVVGAAFPVPGVLATAGTDRTLRLWRTDDGAPVRSIELPGVAAALHGCREGSRLLVLSYATTKGPFMVQAYDGATGAAIGGARQLPLLVSGTAFSPDGKLAAAISNNEVHVWRVDDGALVGAAPLKLQGRPRAIAFARNGREFAVAAGQQVTVHSTADGRELAAAAHGHDTTAIAFDNAGRRVLSGSRDRTARLWQLATDADGCTTSMRESATLVGHQGPVHHVEFDADDQFALTATGEGAGELRVFDVGAGRAIAGTALHRYEAGPSIEVAEFTADGRSVLAVAGNARAMIWDFGRAVGVLTLRQSAGGIAVAVDAAGERALTGGGDERLRAWSTADGSLLWTTPALGDPLTCIDIDDARRRATVGIRRSGVVHSHALADGAALGTIDTGAQTLVSLRHLVDGRLFAAGNRENGGMWSVWSVDGSTCLGRGETPRPIGWADAAPDRELAAIVGQDDSTLRLLDLRTGALVAERALGRRQVVAVRFTAKDATLLVADSAGVITVHGPDGAVRTTLPTGARLRTAAWSSDGRVIATGGDENGAEAVLWNVADGTERLRFRGHRGPIDGATMFTEGRAVATAARDGTVCLWPTDPAAVARGLVPLPPADAGK
ncbi:MAG: WD40 repeat domain-containing serine/threonine protein kinase [Planctomycetota bacterium]